MGTMTVQEIFEAIDQGMAEVRRRLAAGELDGSGRFYTDQELTDGVAIGWTSHPKEDSSIIE